MGDYKEMIRNGIFAFEQFAKCKYPILAKNRVIDGTNKSVPHQHDYVQVLYCYDNYYYNRVGEKTFLCEKGSLLIIPAGIEHDDWYDEPARVLNLDISYDVLLRLPPDQYKNTAIQLFLGDFSSEIGPDFSYYRMLSPKSQEIVEKVFSWFMLLNYQVQSSPTNAQIFEQLEEIFSLPEFVMPEPLREKALHTVWSRVLPIMKIVSYLNDHYSEKITDEQLLQVGNISRAVMYRYFKRVIGLTYSVYLQKLRVRRAHLYMKNTTYHITQIAQLCGFYDVCHLSRAYTKYMGRKPIVQRQLFRERNKKK